MTTTKTPERSLQERFRASAAEENPPVADALKWCDLADGQRLRMARRYLQALRLGRANMMLFDELHEYFKKGFDTRSTWASYGLDALIREALKLNPLGSRKGYAHDLSIMQRFSHGDENPVGWVPFMCIIGGQARGLVALFCPMRPQPGDDRILFTTMAEVMKFLTDGPEDELDELED